MHVLVAPVVDEGANSQHVYFPQGCWRTHARNHKQRFIGPEHATVKASLGKLPYFLRCHTCPFASARKHR